MLAVFDESVATSPKGLFVGEDDSSLSMDILIQQLPSNSVIVNLGHNSCYMGYSSSTRNNFTIPRMPMEMFLSFGVQILRTIFSCLMMKRLLERHAGNRLPFPKGCFLTSSGGLRNYEHPHNELKAVPWIDSEGQVCGATYVVDEGSKHAAMPRHGSAADWFKIILKM